MKISRQRPQGVFVQPVRYELPPFQRRYVWKQDERWEPLWDDVEDLARSIRGGRAGRTPLHGRRRATADPVRDGDESNAASVVDGQQRLTTLQMLIDAIQEVVEASGA